MKGGMHPADLSFADAFAWYVGGVDPESDECLLWPITDTYGYGRFTYDKRPYRAHVASHTIFNGVVPEGMGVLHAVRCTSRACVVPRHLRLGTQKENVEDMRSSGTMVVGEDVITAKLTEESVREIRRLHATGATQAGIAGLFGVHQSNISYIVRGKTWRHVLEESDPSQGS